MVKRAEKKGTKKAGGRKPARRMLQNVTEKSVWTEEKEVAALLVAQDRLSDELIAAELKITRMTLFRWKAEPEFKNRVTTLLEEIKAAVVARGIAEKQNRIDAYNDRWRRMQSVIEARAVEHAGYVGGGATGLLVKQKKIIGKGDDAETVEEYAVDTPLLRELREHEKQAAIELEQWQERSTALNLDLSDCSDDELERIANGEDPARVLAGSRRRRA